MIQPPPTLTAPVLPTALLGTLLVALLASPPIGAAVARQARDPDGAPMVVTTDTRDYCLTLSDQIQSYGALPTAVRDLQREGRDLCSAGRVRGGINRLRRALMVLRAGHQPADASRAISSTGRAAIGRRDEEPRDASPDSPDD